MKIAFYIGNHKGDGFLTRAGWWLIKLAQKGKFGHATHCESIIAENEDGSCVIAGSSLRDGGVRSKTVVLNSAHWRIIDVPLWDVSKAQAFLAITSGMKYDLRGALATVLPGRDMSGSWFCNEWCAAPFLETPANFHPAQFMAICMSIGTEVTDEYFLTRGA